MINVALSYLLDALYETFTLYDDACAHAIISVPLSYSSVHYCFLGRR